MDLKKNLFITIVTGTELIIALVFLFTACSGDSFDQAMQHYEEHKQNEALLASGGPSVKALFPAGGATEVASNSGIIIQFDCPADASRASLESRASECRGTVQVSPVADFSYCIPLNNYVIASQNKTFWFVRPKSAWLRGESHYVRVANPLYSILGVPAASVYTSVTAFTVGIAADLTIPTVVSIAPANAASGVSRTEPFTITFSERMNPTTLSYNTSAGDCAGTIQLSYNSFESCVALQESIVSNDMIIISVAPALTLRSLTNYKLRVRETAEDTAGNTSGTVTLVQFTTGE